MRTGQKIDIGVYTSDNISVAQSYALKFPMNGINYQVIYMNRCNPKTLKQASRDIFVTNSP